LGQDLFAPPNVKGWDGGISWITTNTLLARYNFADTLVRGTTAPLDAADFARKSGRAGGKKIEKRIERIHLGGVDVEKIFTPKERADKDLLVTSLERRLLQSELTGDQDLALSNFLDSKQKLNDADILTTIRLVMCTPEYQVT
ncbi:MAG: DUF1800 family protein, partial [Limisphaerales bacterium]